MSELKWKWAYYPYLDPPEKQAESALKAGYIKVVNKSEADKVIAELKEKHKNEVKELLCLIRDKENNFNRAFDSEEKEIRHNKYKRCLGIAAVCFEKSYSTTLVKYDKESGYRLNFYDWWGKRWLELAKEPTWEKFLQLIHKEGK